MRVISYNILNGGVGRADPIGEVLEAQDADVIVLVEADDAWVVDRIAKRLGMHKAVGAGDKHFVVVLSRRPILQSINHAALDTAGPRCWLEARIDRDAESPLTVFAVHLHPRATLADEETRVTQLRRLLNVTQPLRDSGTPHVIAGDFNANAPQQQIDVARCKKATRKAFDENGGVIPRNAISLLLDHGYVDTLAAARGEAAFEQATFTTHEPGQRVDYIFTHGLRDNGIADAWVEGDRLATYASDHYPVGVEIRRLISDRGQTSAVGATPASPVDRQSTHAGEAGVAPTKTASAGVSV